MTRKYAMKYFSEQQTKKSASKLKKVILSTLGIGAVGAIGANEVKAHNAAKLASLDEAKFAETKYAIMKLGYTPAEADRLINNIKNSPGQLDDTIKDITDDRYTDQYNAWRDHNMYKQSEYFEDKYNNARNLHLQSSETQSAALEALRKGEIFNHPDYD